MSPSPLCAVGSSLFPVENPISFEIPLRMKNGIFGVIGLRIRGHPTGPPSAQALTMISPPSAQELFSGSGRKGWSAGAGNQDQFPANRGFRAQAGVSPEARRTKAEYGHPKATLKPPSGHLVANR